MKVTDIIVLENQKRYSLLQEAVLNNLKYFIAAEINNEGLQVNDSTVVLKLIVDEDGDYVQLVNDTAELNELYKALKESKN